MASEAVQPSIDNGVVKSNIRQIAENTMHVAAYFDGDPQRAKAAEDAISGKDSSPNMEDDEIRELSAAKEGAAKSGETEITRLETDTTDKNSEIIKELKAANERQRDEIREIRAAKEGAAKSGETEITRLETDTTDKNSEIIRELKAVNKRQRAEIKARFEPNPETHDHIKNHVNVILFCGVYDTIPFELFLKFAKKYAKDKNIPFEMPIMVQYGKFCWAHVLGGCNCHGQYCKHGHHLPGNMLNPEIVKFALDHFVPQMKKYYLLTYRKWEERGDARWMIPNQLTDSYPR